MLGAGLDNVILDQLEVDPASPNRVRFNVLTRGRRDALLLKLAGASSGTTFRVELEPTKEEGIGRPETVRPAADLPAESLTLPFVELADGRLERELRVGQNTDRVTIEIVDRDAALDRDFEYTDMEGVRPGDYYYVRVTQLDSGRAWSSPFWVGEQAARARSGANASRGDDHPAAWSRGARATLRPPARPDQGKLRYARAPRLLTAAWPLSSRRPRCCARTEGQSRGDYLDRELRARVEKLEARGGRRTDHGRERARTLGDDLWKWANAYALDGGVIPIDVPSNVRQVTLDALAEASGGGRATPPSSTSSCASSQFKEKEPDALGTLRFASTAPIEAESFTTVEEIYTVGARALEPGATHPDRPPDACPIRARCSTRIRPRTTTCRSARRTPARAGRSCASRSAALHSTRLKDQPNLAFQLEAGRVEPGETVTVTFGDKSGGSRGFRVQTWSTDLLLLPIYVDFAGDGLFLSMRLARPHGDRAAGGRWRRASFVPSIVGAGRAVPALGAQRGPLVQSQQRADSRLRRPARRQAVAQAAGRRQRLAVDRRRAHRRSRASTASRSSRATAR